jgi:uncharacterized membrane protein YqjE
VKLEPASAPPDSAAERVRGLLAALLRYVGARGKLFQIESQEASGHLGKIIVRAVIGLGLIFIGWLLTVPAVVMLLSAKLNRPWEHIALGLAALHLFVGLIYVWAAKSRWAKARLFEESLNQFERDRTWVAPQTPPN